MVDLFFIYVRVRKFYSVFKGLNHVCTCLSDFNIFTQVIPLYLDLCGHITSRLADTTDMIIYRTCVTVSCGVFV